MKRLIMSPPRTFASSARAQYGVCDLDASEEHVLMAAWWASYHRLQPGKACGSQSAESEHSNGLRTALLRDVSAAGGTRPTQRTLPLRRAKPAALFPAFAQAVKAIGLQLEKAHAPTLVDRPTSEDPVVCNGELLPRIGRSMAAQLFQKQAFCHKVVRGDDVCVVMPRTLLRWVVPESPAHEGRYELLPDAAHALTAQEASQCVDLALEKSARKLLQLWRQLKIVTGNKWTTHILDLKLWKKWRYHKVVVVSGATATALWQCNTPLCPCLPFALGATCEHARCATSLLVTGDVSLAQLGKKTRVGRPAQPDLQPSFRQRGASSGQIMTAAAHVSSDAASKAAAASQFASRPPVVLSDIAESLDTCLTLRPWRALLRAKSLRQQATPLAVAGNAARQSTARTFKRWPTCWAHPNFHPKPEYTRTTRTERDLRCKTAAQCAAVTPLFLCTPVKKRQSAMLSVLRAQPIALFTQLMHSVGWDIRVQAHEHAWLASFSALARSS